MTLDGSKTPGMRGTEWHAAYRFHQRGKTSDDLADGQGIVIGVHGYREICGAFTLEWLAEYTLIDNVNGQSRNSLQYFTIRSVLAFGRYNFSATYTGRPHNISGGTDIDDKLLTVSAGLNFSTAGHQTRPINIML